MTDSISDKRNTILGKEFPGGNLLLVNAITPADLAQHTIRYLFCDEPDKYPASAGVEGDPMDLAWERCLTFGSRRKRVLACSPTVQGASRIGKAYAASDRRKPWVPCPYCGEKQVLLFRKALDSPVFYVKWDTGVAPELRAATARYHCQHCDHPWTELDRWEAIKHVEWRAEKPFAGVAGFWVNHLYLPFTWKKIPHIADHFLAAKEDRQKLKVFVNTVLAEEWIEPGQVTNYEMGTVSNMGARPSK
jgi:phage terminase large subunit GpA-like protein